MRVQKLDVGVYDTPFIIAADVISASPYSAGQEIWQPLTLRPAATILVVHHE